VTQFGRALLALNIDIICANSPQAKGRIERAFGTLQDRMVKELRLAGISSIAAANAWLAGFIAVYNTRFGRDPANPKNLHRPLAPADDLDEILAWREQRTVTRNHRADLSGSRSRMVSLRSACFLAYARGAGGLARARPRAHARTDGREVCHGRRRQWNSACQRPRPPARQAEAASLQRQNSPSPRPRWMAPR
jgi:hypothetical protein